MTDKMERIANLAWHRRFGRVRIAKELDITLDEFDKLVSHEDYPIIAENIVMAKQDGSWLIEKVVNYVRYIERIGKDGEVAIAKRMHIPDSDDAFCLWDTMESERAKVSLSADYFIGSNRSIW